MKGNEVRGLAAGPILKVVESWLLRCAQKVTVKVKQCIGPKPIPTIIRLALQLCLKCLNRAVVGRPRPAYQLEESAASVCLAASGRLDLERRRRTGGV